MGVFALLFTVMAFNAPLMTVVGTLPIPIGFGNGAGAPVLYLVGAGFMALLAVGFIKMYPYMTNSGGFYVYITAGLGKAIGLGAAFLAQGTYFVVVLGSASLFGFSISSAVVGAGGPGIPWWVYGLGLIAVVGFFGYRQLDLSAKVLTVLLTAEIIIVLAYNLVVVLRGGASGLDVASAFDPSVIFGGSVGVALLISVACMGGFEATVIFREEVRNPQRTIPRATFIFILVVGVTYGLTTWSEIQAVGTPTAQAFYGANPAGAVLETMQTYFGRVGHDLVNVLLSTSILAAALSAHNVAARYAFNLGNDRIFPRSLSGVHAKHGSPHRASLVITTAAVAAIVPFVIAKTDPNFLIVQFLSAFSYAFLVLLTIASVAVAAFLMRRKPEGTNIWHRVVAPILALAGIGGTLVFATTNLDVLFGSTGPVVGVVLSIIYGLVVVGIIFALVLKRNKPEIYALIGRQ
ncbi:APC family permease [Mycolicibacterium sp. CBMA 226]|uniref:APC family permease n=1 Tax=Mycolicibacterium sp. CBMA 226 TaxID=2606611 RepID=UPI0012DC7316|nr:APC family permease [Mycolicibacterium sp. CBMA 226]MUL79046.1 APC family permease [Mycolicibacterium sp. CBMA 226]